MADEILKPTQQQAVEYLVRLGKALHAYAYPRSPMGLARALLPHEASRLKEEIASCEKVVSTAACDPNHRYLRSVLDVRRDLIPNSLDIRIVAYLAWHSLTSESIGTSVAVLSKAAGLDSIEEMIQARHAIRQFVVKGDVLVFKDESDLLPGYKLVRLLTGDNRPPIIWTEATLKHEAEEWQRQKDSQSNKPASSPRHAEPPPSAQKPSETPNLLTAKGIFDALKNEVIGIDVPLRRFSAQMSLHMRRLEQIRKGVRPSVGPIVTLLIGSSGSGKTWMAENFARVSGLPYAVADMTGVSQASYVGLSVDECFYGLLANKTKPSEAQKGIVVLDEFDKVCAKSGGHSTSDPQGRGIQAELLKPLEGCKLPLGSRRSNTPFIGTLDTYETNFICAGAFEFLRDMLADSNRKSAGLGFGSAGAKNLRGDVREALVRYGFLEQIINRIGAIIILSDPTPEQIVRITSHSGTGLLARWNSFANSFGISLDLTDEAIQYLAHWACETRGYSRSVKTVLGSLVEQHLYDDKPGDINVWLADVKRAIEETEGAEGLQK